MRIMLVISSLHRGGAERVFSIMANHWVARGYAVSVVTLVGKGEDGYQLRSEIERVALGCVNRSKSPVHAIFNNLRRIFRLRIAARRWQPDVVISFLTESNVRALLALYGTDIPVIVSERADPTQLHAGSSWSWLRSRLYGRATAIVVQTERVRNDMRRGLPTAKFAVIPNPVPAVDPDGQEAHASLHELVHLPANAKVIAAMGRLDPQKGFDLLIEAFAKLSPRHPAWHLVILGEGAVRSELERQIARLGLATRVYLPGLVSAARRFLSEASLFVLSSRFEGFPNALLEAMACGLPVVSFDCSSGPREIIHDGHDGLLVETGNVTALGAAMSALMQSPARREELGKNARGVLARYSLDRIMALWDLLLSREVQSPTHKNI